MRSDFDYEAAEMARFFDDRAEGYEEHMASIGAGEREYRRISEALMVAEKRPELLDLGCGTGLELRGIFDRLPDARVTCLDLSEGMLEVLRGKYHDKEKQLTILRTSFVSWDYPAERFDAAVSANAMHHFTESPKTELYRKIFGTLKKGGLYVEQDFMVDEAAMRRYRARYDELMQGENAQVGAYHIDIPFTVEKQVRLLRDAGFAEVRVFHQDIKEEGSNAMLVALKA